jgi:hypothetical protein
MSENFEPMETPINNRPLFDHKNNKFNRMCVDVFTTDAPQVDGANHAYRIEVYKRFQSDDQGMVEHCDLKFQNGGLKEVGPNGITDQALLAIVIDRIRGFNDGPYRCRENSLIITKLEEALMWMEKRGNDRARRGVEGERTV